MAKKSVEEVFGATTEPGQLTEKAKVDPKEVDIQAIFSSPDVRPPQYFEPVSQQVPRSQYDSGFVFGSQWEPHFAQRQGKLAEAGNAVAQIGLNLIPGILGSVGAIGDVEDWFAGIHNFDDEVGNSLTRWANKTKETVTQDIAPVYQQEPGKTMNLGSSEWWFKNGASVAGSAAEFAILGFGLGSLITKGLTASKWLSAVDAATGATKLNTAGELLGVPLNAFALNHAESILDATQTYDDQYKQAIEAGKSDTEAKTIASAAAAHNVNINRFNILLNLSAVSGIMKGARGTRNIRNLVPGIQKLALEGGQEYLEESVNYFAQQRGAEKGEALRTDKNYTGVTVDKLMNDLTSAQGVEAGFLGLLGGVAQTGIVNTVNTLRGTNQEEKLWIQKQQDQLAKFDELRKTNKLSNIESTTTALKEHVDLMTTKNALETEINELVSNNKKVPDDKIVRLQQLNRQLLVSQAYQNFQLGTTDYLEKAYQDIAALTDEQAVENGFKAEELNPKSPAYYKTKAENALQDIKAFESIYNKVQHFANPRELFQIKAKELEQSRQLSYFNTKLSEKSTAAQEALHRFKRSDKLAGFSGSLLINELFTPEYGLQVADINNKGLIQQRKSLITRAKKLPEVQEFQQYQNLVKDLQKEIDITKEEYLDQTSSKTQEKLQDNLQAQVKEKEEFLKSLETAVKKTEQAASAKKDTGKKIAGKVIEAAQADVSPDLTQELDIVQDLAIKVLESSTPNTEDALNQQERDLVNKHRLFFDETLKRMQENEVLQEAQHVNATAGDPSNLTNTDQANIQGEQEVLSSTTLSNILTDTQERQPLNQANNVLAWLSRGYSLITNPFSLNQKFADIDNQLNKELQEPRILDNTFLDVGDEVTLEVDPAGVTSVIINNETIFKPWNEAVKLPEFQTSQAVTDNIPIAVKKNGTLVAYLHRPDWITDKTTKMNVAQDREQLRLIRSKVVLSGTPIKTKITKRSLGKLFIDYTKKPKAVAENLKDTDLNYAVFYNGSLTDSRTTASEIDKLIVLNRAKLKEGRNYVLLPVKKADAKRKTEAEYWAVPVLNNKLSPEVINSIARATGIFYKTLDNVQLTESDQKIVDQLKEVNKNFRRGGSPVNFDITKPDGLRNYLDLFIYSHNKDITQKNQSLDNYLATNTSLTTDYYAHEVGDKGVFFGRGKIGTVARSNDIQVFMDQFKEHLSNRYSHASLDYFNTNVKVPIIKPDGSVTVLNSQGNYLDYLKQTAWSTNVVGQNISTDVANPNYIYAIQQIIEFDSSFATAESDTIIDETTGEAVAVNPADFLLKSRLSVIDEEGNIKPGSFKLTKEADSEVEDASEDLPGVILEEAGFEKLVNKYKIPGLKPAGERSLINWLVGQVNESFIKSSEKQSWKALMQGFKNLFEDNADSSKFAKTVVDNWTNVERLAAYYLQANYNYSIDTLSDEESSIEPFNINSIERDPASGLTEKFRRFLGTIDNPNRDSIVMGFEKFNPNEIYTKLSGLLADQDPVFDTMVQRLETLKPHYNFIQPVLDRLTTADEQLKAEFVVSMSKHYVNMKHLYIVKSYVNDKVSGYTGYIRDDNSSSKAATTRDNWINNLYYTDLVYQSASGSSVYDKDKAAELYKQFEAVDQDNIAEFDINNWLTRVGITLSPTTIAVLQSEGLKLQKTNKFDTYNKLFFAATGPFRIIANNLKTIAETKEQVEVENSNLVAESSLYKLAKLDSQYNDTASSHTHRSGASYVFSYADNKYLTDRIRALKEDRDLLTGLADRSFSKHSWWLKQMLKVVQAPDGSTVYARDKEGKVILDNASNFNSQFELSYLSLQALKEKGVPIVGRRSLDQLSVADHEKAKFMFFQNTGQWNRKTERVAEFFMMTLSNKNTMLSVKSTVPPVELRSDNQIADSTVDFLIENTVLPEMQRMWDYKDSHNINNYTEGNKLFYFFPELNTLEIFNEDGSLKLDVLQTHKEEIRQIIRAAITKEVGIKLQQWKDYGFITGTEEHTSLNYFDNNYINFVKSKVTKPNNSQVANYAATEMAVAYINHNVNLFQAVSTDPATQWKSATTKSKVEQVYDTFDNIGKRLGGEISPGRDLALVDKNQTYNLAVVQDVKLDSKALDKYAELHPELASSYKNINSTDAVEFITLPEKLLFMRQSGKLNPEQLETVDNIIDQIDSGKEVNLNLRQLNLILQVDKPIMVGTRVDSNNIESKVYVKSAAFTLIPQFIRGTELEKLNKLMLDKNIDRLAFSSAVKLGSPRDIIEIFDKEGNLKDNAADLLTTDKDIFKIKRSYLKLQQETPLKEETQISRVSQASKLLFVDILDKTGFKLPGDKNAYTATELKDLYNDYYDQLFKNSYDELLKDLNINPNSPETWSPHPEKLNQIIQTELLERGYPPHDLDALEIVKEGDKARFKISPWALAKSGKLEAFLTSIVTNRIIKQKFNGYSFVMASEAGFKFKDVKELSDISEELKNKVVFTKKFTGELKPALENNYLHQVVIPWKFKTKLSNYLNADNTLDLSKVDPEMLKLFGMRIPNQGPNSTAALEVVGFLPPEAGDAIIAPLDFVTQMGSDFDIDKLYTYIPNYEITKDGKLSKIREKSETNLKSYLQNKILDIHLSINTNPDPDIQRSITRPLDTIELKNIARELENIAQSRQVSSGIKALSPVSSTYQATKYNNSVVAATAIGAFAVQNTFNAIAQYVPDLKLIRSIDNKGKINYSKIKFGNVTFNGETDISKAEAKKANSFKSNNISALLSAAVDDEKEQILYKIGVNLQTISMANLLTQAGFSLKTTAYFLKQDIIQEYTKQLTLNRGNSKRALEAVMKQEQFKDVPQVFMERGGRGEEISQAVRDQFYEFYNSSTSDMKSYLEQGPGAVDYKLAQYALLQKFIDLSSNEVKVLRKAQSLLNTDTAGTGKNMFESLSKQRAVENLTQSKLVNAHKLIGDYVDKFSEDIDAAELREQGYIEGERFFIKPTTIPGFAAVYGLFTNNKIWEQYFPYTNPNVTTVINTITVNLSEEAEDFLQEAERNQRIFNQIKSYLYTDNSVITQPIHTTRRELLFDYRIVGPDKKPGKHLSLASILHEIRTNPDTRKIIKEHKFLNNLFTNISSSDEIPKTIMFKNPSDDETTNFEIYSDVINSLKNPVELGEFNGIKYTTRNFIEHLILATQLSGTSALQNDLLQFIPVDYLVQTKVAQGVNNYQFSNLNKDKSTTESIPRFVEQYFQHYPYLVEGIEDRIYDIGDNITESVRDEEVVLPTGKIALFSTKEVSGFNLKASSKLELRNYYHKKTGPGKYLLFKLVDKTTGRYAKISTLGGINYHEFNANTEVATSNISSNNPINQPIITRKALTKTLSELNKVTGPVPKDTVINLGTYNLRPEYYTLTSADLDSSLNAIQQKSTIPANQEVAKFLRDRLKDFNITVKSSELVDTQTSLPKRGNVTISGDDIIITLNLPALSSKEDIELTLLHELLHAVTIQAILDPKNDRQRRAVRNLNNLYEAFKSKFYDGKSFKELQKEFGGSAEYIAKVYPAKNLKEFVVAALTQPEFQKMLQELEYSSDQTFWEKFKEFLNLILKSFGVDINTTVGKAINDVLILTEVGNKPGDSKDINSVPTPDEPVDLDTYTLDTFDQATGLFVQEASELSNKALNKLLGIKDDSKEVTSEDLPMNVDDSNLTPGDRFSKLIAEKRSHLSQLYKRISEMNAELGKATTAEAKTTVLKRREKVQSKIQEAQDELNQAKALVKIEDLLPIAETELKEVNLMLARGANLDFKDLNIIDSKIKLWKNYADNFLTKEERVSANITNLFDKVLSEANRYDDQLATIKDEKILKLSEKVTGKQLDPKSFFAAIKDISGIAAETLDLSNADHALLQTIFEYTKQTEVYSKNELDQISSELKTLLDNVKGKEAITGKNFENFFEVDEEGNRTGNLVMPYSPAYLKTKYDLIKEAKAYQDQGDKVKSSQAWKKVNEFTKNNELVFDLRKLVSLPGFEEEFKKDNGKLEEELKKTVGEKEFRRKLDRALTYLERYKADKAVAELEFAERYAIEEDRKAALEAWDNLNSPFLYFNYRGDAKNTSANKGWKYTEYTPKAFDEKGNKTKWYSEKYLALQQDADVHALHDYIVNLLVKLRRYMPENKAQDFYINSLPALQKSVLESFHSEGMTAAMSSFMDSAKQSLISTDISQLLYGTAEDGRTLTVKLDTINNKIDRIYNRKLEDYKRINSVDIIPEEVIRILKAEAAQEVQSDTSMDLTAMLGAYSAALVTYHHKSRVEDAVRLAEEVFNNRIQEVKTNAAGEPMMRRVEGRDTLEILDSGLPKLKGMLKYSLDRWYQIPKAVEGKTDLKLYTKKELTRKEALEKELETYTTQVTEIEKKLEELKDLTEGMSSVEVVLKTKELNDALDSAKSKQQVVQEQLDKLGGVVTGTGIGNWVLKYLTIKGLGWNVFGGLTNLGFGWIGNVVEAAAGRYFNEDQLAVAYKLSLHSIGKSVTLNSYKSDTAVKIRTLMDNFDVLKKTAEELFKDKVKLTGPLQSLHWSQVYSRSEYLNQAPVMIAMMLNHPINKLDGTVSNLWKAYGEKGEWNTSEFGEIDQVFDLQEKAKLKSAIDKAIKKIHGNYDPNAPIKLKGTTLGKFLAIFKTWMFEGFNNRFERESEDHILGHTRKGRYRSYSGGSLALAGAGLGSLLLPGIGTAVGAGIGFGIGSKLRGTERFLPEFQNMSQFQELAWSTKYLIRKLSFGLIYKGVSLEERFTSIDAMNMRKNMTELSLLLYAVGLVMILKNLAEDEDDEEKKMFLTYSLNILHRLQQDIGFYADPISFKEILKDPIAATGIVTDSVNFLTATMRYVNDDDEIPTGRLAGESRLSRAAMKLVPGARVIKSTSDLMNQEY